MLKNYLKIVSRNLWRYKGYTSLNIIGMAIGILLNMILKMNAGIDNATLISSVIVLFVIAGITSGIKVWQAIRTNPVNLLRTE
jgi:ABC-type antimicrobial peptide transport system permease subunit